MKVLHVSKYYPPFRGGIEKVVHSCVQSTQIRGVENSVLAFTKTQSEDKKKDYPVYRFKELFNVLSTPVSVRYFFWCIVHANEYDIIHLHLPNPIASLAIVMAPRKYQSQMILHWHSDIVRQKRSSHLYIPLLHILLRKADAVITTSEKYALTSQLVRNYFNKVTVIPIGISDKAHLKIYQTPILKSFKSRIERFSGTRRIIFFLGRHTYYKGLEYLIYAAKNIVLDYCIVIGGCGPLSNRLKELTYREELAHKVHFAGELEDDEANWLMRNCYCFCLPSIARSEAFGVVQLEAMMNSKPVISTDIIGSGVSWVNKHDESGFIVPPKSSLQLADMLNKLSDADTYKRLSFGARARYEAMFTDRKMGQRLVNLYKRNRLSSELSNLRLF